MSNMNMKLHFILFILLIISMPILAGTDTNSRPSFPFVTRSASPFVQPTNTVEHSWAWANDFMFFPQSHPKLVKGQGWEDMRDEYETKLVNLAKDMKLDHTALAACLKVALDDKRNKNLAVVPVAACQVNGTNDTIWVISCVWEVAEWVVETWVEEKRRTDKLDHMRVFAVSSKTKAILAFLACD